MTRQKRNPPSRVLEVKALEGASNSHLLWRCTKCCEPLPTAPLPALVLCVLVLSL